jgi:hypothetical protein
MNAAEKRPISFIVLAFSGRGPPNHTAGTVAANGFQGGAGLLAKELEVAITSVGTSAHNMVHRRLN